MKNSIKEKERKSLLRRLFLKKAEKNKVEYYSVSEISRELDYHVASLYKLKAQGVLPFKRVLLDGVASAKKRWQIVVPKAALIDYLKRREFEESRFKIEPYKPLSDEDVDQILLENGESESDLLPAPKAKLPSNGSLAPSANALNALADHYGLRPEAIQKALTAEKEAALKKRRKDAEDIAYIRQRQRQALDREKEKWRQMIASYVGYKLNQEAFKALCKRLSWDSPASELYQALEKAFSRSYIYHAISYGKEVSDRFVEAVKEGLALSDEEIFELFQAIPKISVQDLKKNGLNSKRWNYAKSAYEAGLKPGRALRRG